MSLEFHHQHGAQLSTHLTHGSSAGRISACGRRWWSSRWT